jgi:non-ribosomal peptide synthetase component F
MIPIRCSNDCDTSFDHLLTAVKDDVLEAMAHSEVPFDTIVDAIGNEKDSSCFPLGQVVINYQIHGKIPKYSTKDFEIHDLTTEDMPTACELNLEALEDDKGLGFRLEY